MASPVTAADLGHRLHLALPPVASAAAHALLTTERATGVMTLQSASRGKRQSSVALLFGALGEGRV